MFGKEKKSLGSLGLGMILWLIGAVVIMIMFIVNHKRIASNLKSTGFFDRVFKHTPSFVENAEEEKSYKIDVPPVKGSGPVAIDLDFGDDDYYGNSERLDEREESSGADYDFQFSSEFNPEENVYGDGEIEIPEEIISEDDNSYEKKQSVVRTEIKERFDNPMRIKLYFMVITASGSVNRREVIREMNGSNTPLMDAVNALIEGPDSSEVDLGCRTLISSGTKLLSASLSGGVAYLNFSEDFEFNKYGIEGLRGQLQQIVFTATSFPKVESVQFLVENEKKEYLGSEGVWIGTPLSRDNF